MPIGRTYWYLLMRFSLVNIVSCQFFNLWIKYPKLPFTWCNDIRGYNYSLTFVRWMFGIYDATTFMIKVAWSQSVTPPCVHSSLIFYIVWFKQTNVPSKGSIELPCSSKPPTSSIGCTLSSMVLIKLVLMTPSLLLVSHHFRNPIHPKYALGLQIWPSSLHA